MSKRGVEDEEDAVPLSHRLARVPRSRYLDPFLFDGTLSTAESRAVNDKIESDVKVRRRRLTSSIPRVESALCFNSMTVKCFQALGFECQPAHPYIKGTKYFHEQTPAQLREKRRALYVHSDQREKIIIPRGGGGGAVQACDPSLKRLLLTKLSTH